MKANTPIAVALSLTALCLIGSGCSGICTYRATKDGPVRGLRVYQPKVYLFVDVKASKLVVLPDPDNAYDVKPWSVLAKTDLTLKTTDGLANEAAVNLDSTAGLALIQKVAELAAGAAKDAAKAVSEQELPGNFGLDPGIYTFTADGKLARVSKP
jgi:hypothetical protein